jgi:Na+-translocating ferredoxin:NAD+ oxidoreductase subunit G
VNKRELFVRELLPLPIIALIAALLLTAIYLGTQTRIAANQQRAADTIVLDALTLPADTELTRADITNDTQLLTLSEPHPIYLARRGGQVIALIVPVTARDGYNGIIELIIGIAPDGTILGVQALKHRETAGLGDRIDTSKSDWIKHFIGKSLQTTQPERWAIKNAGGDFDQITGATVTSRAVIDAVYRALQYFELHREELSPGADGGESMHGARHE